MNARLALIRQQRELLRVRAGLQRLEIAQAVRPWRAAFGLADKVLVPLRALRGRVFLVGAVATLLLIRVPRHRLALWLGRAWTLWGVYRSLMAARERITPPGEARAHSK